MLPIIQSEPVDRESCATSIAPRADRSWAGSCAIMAPDIPSAESMTRGSNSSRLYFPDIWPRRAAEIARPPGPLPVFFAGHVRFFLIRSMTTVSPRFLGVFTVFRRQKTHRLRSVEGRTPADLRLIFAGGNRDRRMACQLLEPLGAEGPRSPSPFSGSSRLRPTSVGKSAPPHRPSLYPRPNRAHDASR